MVAHDRNPSTEEAEEARSRIQGHSGIHSMALCEKGDRGWKGRKEERKKKEGRMGILTHAALCYNKHRYKCTRIHTTLPSPWERC